MAPGIDPRTMGLGEFTARRHTWAQRHRPEGAESGPAAPTADKVARAFSKIPAAAYGRA